MYRPGSITIALLIWFLSEYLAFSFVASKIGFSGALLIGIATSLLGVSVLRKLGTAAIAGLRRQIDRPQAASGDLLDGMLSAIGGILLILPGFISDLVGLSLMSPSLRRWIAIRFGNETIGSGAKSRRSSPDLIDLDAADWRHVEEPARKSHRPRSAAKPPGSITQSDAS
jgi:UPF0716 protein FxsA